MSPPHHFVSNYDFKATGVPDVWCCLPVAQTLSQVSLLFITSESNSMQKVYYPIVKAAAASTNTPIVLLNGLEFENQPLLNSIQATSTPQLYLLDATGTVTPKAKYVGLRKSEFIVEAIRLLERAQAP